MKLLIGNTGLIGTTLKDSMLFDHEFNSSNIDTFSSLEIPNHCDLYLACLPATKWLVNQNPSADLDNILKIIDVISSKSYRNIILYSTIDVYSNSPEFSDEDYIPKISKLDYGSNRYLFELLVKSNIKYEKLLVLRLPALFGKHIKKNIIYDLLNNNQVNKIQLNSAYQWYNLNRLVDDTNHYITTHEQFLCVNLFSEPVNTQHIIDLFPNIKTVDRKTKGQYYNVQTKYSTSRYIKSSEHILLELQEFISEYEFLRKNIRIAICLFGEQRSLLDNLPYWKHLQTKLNSVDFYTAMYVNEEMQHTLRVLQSTLNLKNYHIAFNDLDKFDSRKREAKTPIYIYKTDPKATVDRLMSQLYIRQKSIELVNPDEYDVIILCRTDSSSLNLSIKDIIDVVDDKQLIKASYEKFHIHPGGGGGCMHCTITKKCDFEYHSNDICDLWTIGSVEAMAPWRYIYDNAFSYYSEIQKTSIDLTDKKLHGVRIQQMLHDNEIHMTFPHDQIVMIENDIHCFYPEKLMRVAFKDRKVCHSNNGTVK